MQVERIDHLVLTVQSIAASCAFYEKVLHMKTITFGDNRKALQFGNQKINLHEAGKELEPKAMYPQPGSIDLCLLSLDPMEQILDHLEKQGVEIIEGPVVRSGAVGPIRSVYFRDPDGNLLELGTLNPET